MHKIDHSTATPGGLFTIGDPVGGTPPTVVTDDWLNSVQTEIVSVIEATGDTLDKPDNTQLRQAIQYLIANYSGNFQTGDFVLTMRPAANAGWIVCNDGTIGSAASAATTRANADTQPLYTLIWNSVSNTFAPVTGGRGASAALDFAANKPIALTKMLGRALGVVGSGSGLTARTLGQTVGTETHTLLDTEMPVHNHSVTDPGHVHTVNAGSSNGSSPGGGSQVTGNGFAAIGSSTTGISIQNKGGGGAHNNVQPTTFLHAHIKL